MMETIEEMFKQEYTEEQKQAYFRKWSDCQPGTHERAVAWHAYCDARDGLKQGTSANRHTFINIGYN